MDRTKSTFLVLVAVLLSPLAANADIIVTYHDNGSDLTFDWSGSWDTNGFSSSPNYSSQFIQSNNLQERFYGFVNGYSRIASNLSGYTQTEGSGIFANNFSFTNGTASGDTFALDWVNQTTVYLYAPVGYLAGQVIAGSMTVANTNIAAVGLAAATFDFGIYGEVQFRAAQAVPEPGTLALFGIGLLGLAASRRRKKA